MIGNRDKLTMVMLQLQKFKKFWYSMENKTEIDADETVDIEMILEQGTLCLKIVEMVLPIYQLYSKEAISFEEYLERVNLLMKTDEIHSEEGAEISI